jgi:hypothetical protein
VFSVSAQAVVGEMAGKKREASFLHLHDLGYVWVFPKNWLSPPLMVLLVALLKIDRMKESYFQNI